MKFTAITAVVLGKSICVSHSDEIATTATASPLPYGKASATKGLTAPSWRYTGSAAEYLASLLGRVGFKPERHRSGTRPAVFDITYDIHGQRGETSLMAHHAEEKMRASDEVMEDIEEIEWIAYDDADNDIALLAEEAFDRELMEDDQVEIEEYLDEVHQLEGIPRPEVSLAGVRNLHNLVWQAMRDRRVYAAVMLFVAGVNLATVILAIGFLRSTSYRTKTCDCESHPEDNDEKRIVLK